MRGWNSTQLQAGYGGIPCIDGRDVDQLVWPRVQWRSVDEMRCWTEHAQQWLFDAGSSRVGVTNMTTRFDPERRNLLKGYKALLTADGVQTLQNRQIVYQQLWAKYMGFAAQPATMQLFYRLAVINCAVMGLLPLSVKAKAVQARFLQLGEARGFWETAATGALKALPMVLQALAAGGAAVKGSPNAWNSLVLQQAFKVAKLVFGGDVADADLRKSGWWRDEYDPVPVPARALGLDAGELPTPQGQLMRDVDLWAKYGKDWRPEQLPTIAGGGSW